MERKARLNALLGHDTEQARRLVRLRPELGRQVVQRLGLRGLHTDDDRQPLAAGHVEHLGEFALMVDHVLAHAIDLVGALDDGAALDRMHEVGFRVAELFPHLRDLGQRCRVEMSDAGIVQRLHHQGMGIALDGIENPPGKAVEEGAGRPFQDMGPQQIDRVAGRERRHDRAGVGERRPLLLRALGHPRALTPMDRSRSVGPNPWDHSHLVAHPKHDDESCVRVGPLERDIVVQVVAGAATPAAATAGRSRGTGASFKSVVRLGPLALPAAAAAAAAASVEHGELATIA